MNINIVPMNPKNLYRKQTFSDMKAGMVTELVPVFIEKDGSVLNDPTRTVLYEGSTFLNGQPLMFVIQAKSLEEAIDLFAQTCGGTIQELQSRQIQSQIMSGGGVNGRVAPLIIDQPSRKR